MSCGVLQVLQYSDSPMSTSQAGESDDRGPKRELVKRLLACASQHRRAPRRRLRFGRNSRTTRISVTFLQTRMSPSSSSIASAAGVETRRRLAASPICNLIRGEANSVIEAPLSAMTPTFVVMDWQLMYAESPGGPTHHRHRTASDLEPGGSWHEPPAGR